MKWLEGGGYVEKLILFWMMKDHQRKSYQPATWHEADRIPPFHGIYESMKNKTVMMRKRYKTTKSQWLLDSIDYCILADARIKKF
jgi:hypothetical protein